MDSNREWEQLLEPDFLREKLVSASMFLIAYEFLKESIIGRIKYFYSDALGLKVGEDYYKDVMSLHKSPLYASLKWLQQHGVILEADLLKLEKIKNVRNSLAHELSSLVTKGTDFSHIEVFQEILELLKKIETWWIVNFEIAINPDFNGQEIDEQGIIPGPIISIQLMLEVLSGNQELLNQYKEARKQAPG